ncbi:hypothetical protein D9M73_194630 [compost metagenome]
MAWADRVGQTVGRAEGRPAFSARIGRRAATGRTRPDHSDPAGLRLAGRRGWLAAVRVSRRCAEPGRCLGGGRAFAGLGRRTASSPGRGPGCGRRHAQQGLVARRPAPGQPAASPGPVVLDRRRRYPCRSGWQALVARSRPAEPGGVVRAAAQALPAVLRRIARALSVEQRRACVATRSLAEASRQGP